MAKTIEESNNYLVVEDERNSGSLVFPKTSIYSETLNSFIIRVEPRSKILEIQFSNVGDWFTDDSGSTAFTVETLREFLRMNTWGKVRSEISSLLNKLQARATYYENTRCSKATLKYIEKIKL